MDISRDGRTDRLRGAAVNPTAVAALLIVLLMAVLLAAPGHTVSAKYLNDLMVFLDGGHRVVSGQVPHRDFHSLLGPLVSLLPAAGLLLTGTLGAAMPAVTPPAEPAARLQRPNRPNLSWQASARRHDPR